MGTWIRGCVSRPPASSTSARIDGSAVSRYASTQPAEPAPTMTEAYSGRSAIAISPRETRAEARSSQPGLEHIAQRVAQQVESQHDDEDGEAGEDPRPRPLRDVSLRGGREHPAPAGDVRRDADAEEAQRRLEDDGEAEIVGGQDQVDGQAVGHDVAHDDARRARADGPGGHDVFHLLH